MSNSCLIHWFEQLLFGSTSVSPPPPELKNLILRMEAEDLPWSHIILQGGLTAFPYQVHGDLNNLTDHLEKEWLDYQPHCKTRAVAKFWSELQHVLAKPAAAAALPAPLTEDDAILKDMLEGGGARYDFQSARFWGEVARRFIHLRKPESVAWDPKHPPFHKIHQLYATTCLARGQFLDPLALHLVHHSEYVNAAHWQTPKNLEAFLHDRPSHPLTLSVQALLRQTVDQLLQGEPPSAYLDPRLDALLHNIRVIHESVQQVPHAETPPKLIDIFQRLLALSYRDALWEKEIPAVETPDPFLGTSLLYLTEQLRMAEREKRLLWQQVLPERSEESGSRPPPRICSDSPYARDTPRRPR